LDLDWYRGQYKALDALAEALQMDNGWLEYRLRVVKDALLDQRTLTAESTTTVDRVKVVLLEKEEVLATANGELQKARDALAEAQTALVQKQTALVTAQTQLQQDRATLEGVRSWRAQAEQKARRSRN
jgi:hypothetical protein